MLFLQSKKNKKTKKKHVICKICVLFPVRFYFGCPDHDVLKIGNPCHNWPEISPVNYFENLEDYNKPEENVLSMSWQQQPDPGP